ncbi:MAG TPA: NAD(+) diphosphatase [Jatrophihabitans sp.]|nr:NAD(+) diphosphatase [Jatrophihabitans sp.]
MTAARPPRDPWAVPETPLLARYAHDRLADRRADPAYLERAWHDEDARVLTVSPSGTVAVTGSAERPDLVWARPEQVAAVEGIRVFLGEAAGRPYFAQLASGPVDDQDWRTLREVGAALTDLEVGLLTSAVALRAWHLGHPRCPRCGAATEVAQAGWTRVCPVDGSEHFPRTDPAVIMLVHDGAGRCVLARGPQWQPGRMSVLAGFVEAGESAEAAVAREVSEEVGIRIRDIAYAGSQPHPFPASLMLGFSARLDGDPTLCLDQDEIAEAGWFTRDEVRATADWGSAEVAAGGRLQALPSTMSIARQLINTWLAAED